MFATFVMCSKLLKCMMKAEHTIINYIFSEGSGQCVCLLDCCAIEGLAIMYTASDLTVWSPYRV